MKRYSPSNPKTMKESADGDYYLVDDVEALLEDIMLQLFSAESVMILPED